ncbi:MAG: sel1 repeat family protein, partial [Alphaproteobacteria bacterium]|nr:sel1 repeat family protein [Alphaproteobacteria bacterium]
DGRYVTAALAYQAGDYDKALAGFRELAQRGHAGAAFMLGVMRFHGLGMKRNDTYAAIWFHKAAQQGAAEGQLAFGSMSLHGVGVKQNLVTAYKWLSLAAEYGGGQVQRQAEALRRSAVALMTPAELEAGRREARGFHPRRPGYSTLRP